MTPRAYVVLFLAVSAALLGAMAVTGRQLPEPFGSFNPMNDRIMRVEEVWQHAVKTDKPSCVVFLGDSRTAFHINSARFSTNECEGRNYAFPGFNALRLSLELAEQTAPAKVIVLGLTDGITFVGPKTRSQDPDWKERLLQFRPFRIALVNLQRYTALSQLRPPPDNGWTWNARLGRWNWSSLDNGVPLDKRPAKESSLQSHADLYFKGPRLPAEFATELARAVERLSKAAERVVILLPPQHPEFRQLSEQLAPGQQQALQETAARSGVPVIDCLATGCGVEPGDFIDPVHLTPTGAEKLTAFVSRSLRVGDFPAHNPE